ncbi:hypothetical protein [Massilia sp. Root351]|uniref:hypothetical protein n=1 Tax=Massilia sp. Root351 TaxID=1736522 RepID=UPI000B265681|nr:hypothetical protein [Massilia sp. Root351]
MPSLSSCLPFTAALLMSLASICHADTWRGTAPFCDGSCLPGEQKVGESDYGDGGYCVTGKKALCRNANPACPVTSTKTECYGVVKICENGSADQTGFWRGCTTYACGVCIGIGSTSSALTFGAPPCRQGYVWREAVADDYVCVPPSTRSQAARDNRQAADRRSPNGGPYGPATCKSGYVWREASPSDLVCVTPETRAQTAADNGLAAERRVPAPVNYGRDTCEQGYVWREAIANDRVCVTPQTRAQAWADNAAAASRRSPNGGPSGPDTCKPGFVWREVVPTDHVCVDPAVRQAVASDNGAARQRRVAH